MIGDFIEPRRLEGREDGVETRRDAFTEFSNLRALRFFAVRRIHER